MIKRIKRNFFPSIIALSALSVSASAAFYSVSGLSKLFAGASFEVIIMAGSLEVAKLVIASLLYQYWDTINKYLRTYLTVAAVVLVLITSMGIYGFLSAAYQETYQKLTVNQNKIEFFRIKQNFMKTMFIGMMKNLKESLITFLLYLMRKRPRFKYETRHHLQAFDQQLVLPNLDWHSLVYQLKKKIGKK